MRCRARPYEGNEPYIFVSYAHSSAQVVYPMIEQLVSDGYRVWYDEGLHPGDNWLDVIAEHLDRSAACLAPITPAFCASHNCRSEVSLALNLGKSVISVVMEDFELPLASQLLLGPSHMLKRHDYGGKEGFYRKLYSTPALAPCRGPRIALGMEAVIQNGSFTTVLVPSGPGEGARYYGVPSSVLVCVESSRMHAVQGPVTTVGPEGGSDIQLPGSGLRLQIIRKENGEFLQDLGTPGGLVLDGKRLEQGERRRLGVCSMIGGGGRCLFFLSGSEAQRLRRDRRVHLLCREHSADYLLLTAGRDLILGRGMDLSKAVLTDGAVSRMHARVRLNGEDAAVMDLSSTNGTFLDEKRLQPGTDVPLNKGARLRIGKTAFRYDILTLT